LETDILKLLSLRRFTFLAFAIGAFSIPRGLNAQDRSSENSPTDQIPILHAEAHLVPVDVIVRDPSGKVVHGLKREDFVVTENGHDEMIRYFDEITSTSANARGPALPAMPAGTFSDYSAVPDGGALNVLLLDSFNTSLADQSYVHDQLRQFVKKVQPGTRIAVFGLSKHLLMLQGFSSDPAVFKKVVEHRCKINGSTLLDDSLGAGGTPNSGADLAASAVAAQPDLGGAQIAAVASNLQQFQSNQNAASLGLRVQYTLDAFNSLGHFLSAFPGRKNVIWFSGSFPINVLPDPTLDEGLHGMEGNDEEFRATAALLSRSQVAVYPVDARGLTVDPSLSSAVSKIDLNGRIP
jgi:VWFA-related protein